MKGRCVRGLTAGLLLCMLGNAGCSAFVPGSHPAKTDTEYKIEMYREDMAANSFVQIEYPVFEGTENESLNMRIYERAQEVLKTEAEAFLKKEPWYVRYQGEVTLKNSKIASIVFWGESGTKETSGKRTSLTAVNIDLRTMQEVGLKDLYQTSEEFEKVLFEKAYFPENPVTSYEKDAFAEMLKLQLPEYRAQNPFEKEGSAQCFFKPEGLVLSLPSIHATGSDHFEAELSYSDIQSFYLREQNYWEEE